MFRFGWTASLCLLLAAMTVSFVCAGLYYPYWRFADQDFVLAYQGLLYNDGLGQEYFDHTGYLSYLLIGNWYRLLHAVGLLQVHALSAMPPGADPLAVTAWESLVRAGRVLSFLVTAALTGFVAVALRRIAGDWRIAMIGAIAFGFAGSVTYHGRMLRTELIAGGLVAVAYLLALLAVRDPRARWRPALLGAAAFCATLAMENKLQALLPLLSLPLLVLAATVALPAAQEQSWSRAAWSRRDALVLWLIAIAVAVPACRLLLSAQGLRHEAVPRYHEVGFGLSGLYQFLFAGWIVGAATLFAVWRRVPAADIAFALAAMCIGASLAILVLDIRFSPQNVLALTHPLEHQFEFATWNNPELAREPRMLSGALLARLGEGLADVLRMHTMVKGRPLRPTLILEWMAIFGALVAWRQGDRRLPLAIALIIGVVVVLETSFVFRGLKMEYFIFTEPLIIVAGMLVLVRFRPQLDSPRLGRWLLAGLVLTILWGNFAPVRQVFNKRPPVLWGSGNEICVWGPVYLKRIDRLPLCVQ
jgi:hypothetical protein